MVQNRYERGYRTFAKNYFCTSVDSKAKYTRWTDPWYCQSRKMMEIWREDLLDLQEWVESFFYLGIVDLVNILPNEIFQHPPAEEVGTMVTWDPPQDKPTREKSDFYKNDDPTFVGTRFGKNLGRNPIRSRTKKHSFGKYYVAATISIWHSPELGHHRFLKYRDDN